MPAQGHRRNDRAGGVLDLPVAGGLVLLLAAGLDLLGANRAEFLAGAGRYFGVGGRGGRT